MTNEEIEKMVKLRSHVIEYYSNLVEPHVATSVMNTRDVAYLCEQIIGSIDSLLKNKVEFKR
tara:strand:+ start:2841 stop:3026 length:186 start_codon:yes stop_codon:yes gene_type:complete